MNTHALPPRIPLTRRQIETVVKHFYARVRVDKTLGPLFIGILSNDPEIWRVHEAKIANFWANAILHERSYDGNPMLVHSGISAIEPSMFTNWLALFDQTLSDELPSDLALQWSTLAHRIGRGLRFGVESAHETSGPPILR
ncbi:MAG: group III truncated hemoglobin [Amylibacter sp.]|nr:group III truncated hemoglobin [Amylibacter sp.]